MHKGTKQSKIAQKPVVVSIEPGLGPLVEPADPHPGRKPSEAMEPVVRAATGKKPISIWDFFGEGH